MIGWWITYLDGSVETRTRLSHCMHNSDLMARTPQTYHLAGLLHYALLVVSDLRHSHWMRYLVSMFESK